MKFGLAAICALFMSAQILALDDLPKPYKQCGEFTAKSLPTADRVVLNDGSMLELDLVMMPRMPAPEEKGNPWPYAEYVLAQVAELLIEQNLTLYCAGKSKNRHGLRFAAVKFDDGRWLHEEALKAGLGWVSMMGRDTDLAAHLFAFEDEARDKKAGIWSGEIYKARNAADIESIRSGFYLVVRGKVSSSNKAKRVTYINFGQNYYQDFTIEVPNKVLSGFRKAGLRLDTMRGKSVEVRGWVDWSGGPRIVLVDPVNLRVISE